MHLIKWKCDNFLNSDITPSNGCMTFKFQRESNTVCYTKKKHNYLKMDLSLFHPTEIEIVNYLTKQ